MPDTFRRLSLRKAGPRTPQQSEALGHITAGALKLSRGPSTNLITALYTGLDAENTKEST